MSRPVRVLLVSSASVAMAVLAGACGTERITVPRSDPTHAGAVLFSQRCSGCHTLAFAATHGSPANQRTAQFNQGPNFDVRCERPVTRTLYAIENGGFSGLVMPQNVVVGQDAVEVAQFVAKYAGRRAAKAPGQVTCDSKPVGTLPVPVSAVAAAPGTATPSAAKPATAKPAKTGSAGARRGTRTAKPSRTGAGASKRKRPAHH